MTRRYLSLFPCFVLAFAAVSHAQDIESLAAAQAKVNAPYLYQIPVEGGLGNYKFELADPKTLPSGLVLDKSSGVISGTPKQAQAAPFTFIVLISDESDQQPIRLSLALKVQPAPLRVIGATSGTSSGGAVASSPAHAPVAPLMVKEQKVAMEMPRSTSPGPSAPEAVQPTAAESAQTGGSGAAGGNGFTPPITQTTLDDSNHEWEARAIVGFHQAGASSASSTQNFFFDFYIARALSSTHLWGPFNSDDGKGADPWSWGNRWSLWGDVRIASAPQQIKTGVGAFASGFATSVANLPVNELAQSADFQSGLEFRLHTFLRKPKDKVLGYRTMGLIADFGAMGSFQPPSAQIQIFSVPGKTSLQYPLFAATFPTAANANYIGFVPPDRERFYRNYGLGFRFTTYDRDAPLAPPATYTFSVGQDESITGGIFRSVVGRFEVFYPLPLNLSKDGAYKSIYLFGTSNLRFSKAGNVPTFALQDPNLNLKPMQSPVQAYDPSLALVTVRSTRDTYRIGVGVDLVNLMQSIGKTATDAKAKTAAEKAKAAAGAKAAADKAKAAADATAKNDPSAKDTTSTR